MKVTYLKNITVRVLFDEVFDYILRDCPLNEIRDKIEDLMWDHHFNMADVIDPTTSEVMLTIEKDY